MSSEKKENKEITKDSLMEEEIFEIKEIIERRSGKNEDERHPENGKRSFGDSVKKGIAKFLLVANKTAKTVQKEPKLRVWISSAIGVALLVTVIILAVRLGGVTKELKSVQAMSVSLQEELAAVKNAQKKTEAVEMKQEPLKTKEPVQTLSPTVMPTPIPTATPMPPKYVVCVDAGHGDWDGGAVWKENGVEKRAEKDDNLRMSQMFREALEKYNVEVVMTRETDVFLGLSERAKIANAAKADALISFHRNSFEGEDEVKGVEFWIHNSRPEGAQQLAEDMLEAIMEVGGMESRGVKYGSMSSTKENYSINREANMTSMIVELGFITSANDNAAYDAYGKAYAEGMAKAVYEWLEAQRTAIEND